MSKYETLKGKISEIEVIIKDLKKQNMSNTDMEDYFFNNHKDIMENYPFLVSTLIQNENRVMLDFMLENIRLMENGTKSAHEADVDIGQKIVDDIIKPGKNK